MKGAGRYVIICAGATLVAASLEYFYIPYLFMDGGITGLAVLLGRLSGIAPVRLLPALHLLCLILSGGRVGDRALRGTVAAVGSMTSVLLLVGPLPARLSPTVAAICGGIGTGLGMGMVLRAEGALDGSELLALCLERVCGWSVPRFLFAFNAVLFGAVALLFGTPLAAHSVLAQGVSLALVALMLQGRTVHH